MDRSVPLWLVLFLGLAGLVALVVYGGVVKSVVLGSRQFGAAGEVAYELASFPGMAREVLDEVHRQVVEGGDANDVGLVLPRFTPQAVGLVPVPGSQELGLTGLMMATGPAVPEPGWRVLLGAFATEDGPRHAALMISPTLNATRLVPLSERGIVDARDPSRKLVHGVALLADGSLVVSFDGGASLQRIDRCGATVWQLTGDYHHAVSVGEDGTSIWTLRTDAEVPDGEYLVEVDSATGEILREISMGEIIAANPTIDPLGPLRVTTSLVNSNPSGRREKWHPDPFHLNDIEPLPSAIAEAFPGFAAGDLAISSRSLNLVLVIDPATLAIKWWRSGAWRRQHDPDFQPDGTITVYDNRMNLAESSIVRIDPATMAHETIVEGGPLDFYSRIRGKHQVLDSGHVVVSSPQQGRALEVSADGEVALEMVNWKPSDPDVSYPISELIVVPPDALSDEPCGTEEVGGNTD